MIIIYNEFWDYLTLFYYNEEGQLIVDVEMPPLSFPGQFRASISPLTVPRIRQLFGSKIIHDDMNES